MASFYFGNGREGGMEWRRNTSRMRVTIEQTIAPDSVPLRLNRTRILAICASNPRLRAGIAIEQTRLSRAAEELFREGLRRGG